MSREYVHDTFGRMVMVGDQVAFAGHDYKGRITMNTGVVKELKADKILVERHVQVRNELRVFAIRKVWVEKWKVVLTGAMSEVA